jgi:hypothetical protein
VQSLHNDRDSNCANWDVHAAAVVPNHLRPTSCAGRKCPVLAKNEHPFWICLEIPSRDDVWQIQPGLRRMLSRHLYCLLFSPSALHRRAVCSPALALHPMRPPADRISSEGITQAVLADNPPPPDSAVVSSPRIASESFVQKE